MSPLAGATLDDGSSDWLWPLAEREGIRVMMLAPNQHASIKRIASRTRSSGSLSIT
jgi:hypothetical protein